MKTVTAIATVLIALGAAPVFASPSCNEAKDTWQPMESLKVKLEDQGMQVRQIKIDDGCYEAYVIDAEGKRMENVYNPATFKLISHEYDESNEYEERDEYNERDDDDGMDS